MHAYNVKDGTWREISTGVVPVAMAWDENGDLLLYSAAAKKLYSAVVKEATTVLLRTKTIAMSEELAGAVHRVSVTYKSASALTLRLFYENGVKSGNIRPGIVYIVEETPYINGDTYAVTYLGATKKHGTTITGVTGVTTFTASGTGVLLSYNSFTLPANTCVETKSFRIGERALKVFAEIADTVASTTDIDIRRITLHFD